MRHTWLPRTREHDYTDEGSVRSEDTKYVPDSRRDVTALKVSWRRWLLQSNSLQVSQVQSFDGDDCRLVNGLHLTLIVIYISINSKQFGDGWLQNVVLFIDIVLLSNLPSIQPLLTKLLDKPVMKQLKSRETVLTETEFVYRQSSRRF